MRGGAHQQSKHHSHGTIVRGDVAGPKINDLEMENAEINL
jgi:hypothetical protein